MEEENYGSTQKTVDAICEYLKNNELTNDQKREIEYAMDKKGISNPGNVDNLPKEKVDKVKAVNENIPMYSRFNVPDGHSALTNQEEEHLELLWNGSIDNDRVIGIKSELGCLRFQDSGNEKGRHVSSDIVNAYFELVVKRERTRRVSRALDYFLPLARHGIQCVKGMDIDLSCDYVLFPMFRQNPDHWYLAVIDTKKKTIASYDSNYNCALASGLKSRYKEELKKELELIHCFTREKLGKNVEYKHKINEGKIPQQENTYDCGVFMLLYADYIASGRNLDFKQQHMCYFRCRIALDLVCHCKIDLKSRTRVEAEV